MSCDTDTTRARALLRAWASGSDMGDRAARGRSAGMRLSASACSARALDDALRRRRRTTRAGGGVFGACQLPPI